ncbi:hypothetical protein DBV15_03151 [Temnothorax longispinosus]|uniref:Uncharacterized protein n=1 Tax=Temnothorax longispinosus TaxID=300112 RepID=A0A4V3SB23_9HYME|nr:hypothetical protein DBV15_03151 [Temnothorax longispinosus]
MLPHGFLNHVFAFVCDTTNGIRDASGLSTSELGRFTSLGRDRVPVGGDCREFSHRITLYLTGSRCRHQFGGARVLVFQVPVVQKEPIPISRRKRGGSPQQDSLSLRRGCRGGWVAVARDAGGDAWQSVYGLAQGGGNDYCRGAHSIEILSPGADIGGAGKGGLSPDPSQEGRRELTDLFRATYLLPATDR